MASKDDRDVRKKITPPAGVALQIGTPTAMSAPEDFEEDTAVESNQMDRVEHRSKTAASASKRAASASLTAASASTTAVTLIGAAKDELRKESQASEARITAAIDQYAQRDISDHAEMKAHLRRQDLHLAKQDEQFVKHGEKLDAIGEHVSDVREAVGQLKGAVEIMKETFVTGQVKTRVEVETTAIEQIKTGEYKRSRNLLGWKAIFKIIGAVLATIGVALAGHFAGRWLGH